MVWTRDYIIFNKNYAGIEAEEIRVDRYMGRGVELSWGLSRVWIAWYKPKKIIREGQTWKRHYALQKPVNPANPTKGRFRLSYGVRARLYNIQQELRLGFERKKEIYIWWVRPSWALNKAPNALQGQYMGLNGKAGILNRGGTEGGSDGYGY